MKRFIRRATSATFALAIVFSMAIAQPASAAHSVSTTEFGTMEYEVYQLGNSFRAWTSVDKAASKLITTLEVVNSTTGATVDSTSSTKSNSMFCNCSLSMSTSGRKAFSAHEARGKSSVVKYDSMTGY